MSKHKSIVTLPNERDVVVVRSFDAPRTLVFDAWTQPKLMQRWLLGPPGWTMRVLEFRITQSSGSELLDREVADMIERAQPLPKMPDSMTQTRLKLVVPVQFFLQ
jgi:hypothetical protein